MEPNIGHLQDQVFCTLEEESSLYFTYSGKPNLLQVLDLSYEVHKRLQVLESGATYKTLEVFSKGWHLRREIDSQHLNLIR